MFLKDSPTESRKFLFEIKEECKVLKIIFVKNNFVSDLLGRQHLLQILQTSLTIKNSEKVVKIGCFEKRLRWRRPIFFEIKDGYEVSCLKILMLC